MSGAAHVFSRGWRSAGVFTLSLLGVYWFHHMLAAREPASTWLLWDLLRLWFWQLVLSGACVSAGYRVLEWLDDSERPALDRFALAFPVGLVVFGLGMYLAGMLGIFHRVTATVWPGLLLALGYAPARRAWKAYRLVEADPQTRSSKNGFSLALLLAGGAGIGLLYLGLFSPAAVNYDASWMHLVIAQDYAREGHLLSFDGDWVKNVPHFSSLIHTWGFLVPGMGEHQPLRWMLALHTEFSIFLWTLVGIRVAINWVMQRTVHGGWVALFLFPAIFAHDSNMGGAADHVLALFAIPIVMLAATAGSNFRWQACVLWGMVSGGALLVKLQATYIIAPMAVWFLYAFVRALVRGNLGTTRWRLTRAMIVAALLAPVTALLVFGVHAGRSWWFHNNPLYPLMQDVFTHSRPYIRGAATQVRYLFSDWLYHPPVPFGERIIDSLKMLWSFSFVPHYSYQNNALITGSLFTLMVPFLLFLRPNRRVYFIVLAGIGATFCWAMTYRVDRNIQVFLPLLVVATAAVMSTAWQTGVAAKIGVVLLVGLQLTAAAETWVSGIDRVNASVSLIRSTFNGSSASRYSGYASNYIELGRSLPRDAVVLLHNQHISLGIDRSIVLDWTGFQGQIDYRRMGTANDVWRRFRSLGITHVVYPSWTTRFPTKQGQILFAVFSRVYADSTRNFGGLQLFEFPRIAPPITEPYVVGVHAVDGMQDGLYDIKALSQIETYPPHMIRPTTVRETISDLKQLSEAASIVLVGDRVAAEAYPILSANFRLLSSATGYTLWWRKETPKP